MDEKAKRAEFDEILAAMKLTPDDIETNRQGKFTVANLHQLESAADNAGCMQFVLEIGLVLLMTAALLSTLVTINAIHASIFFAVSLVLLLVLIAGFRYREKLLKRDVAAQRIDSPTGELRLLVIRNKSETSYTLSIADVRQKVSYEAYMLLKTREGEPFTVYYAPHSLTMLSFEPARKSKDAKD